mmetsp:Transcript_18937/g.46497  ORF Transcript_18937/g.46497 Transcript_18937/m.46497 type:complete len:129 (-) Transcript_18937:250-636(-)
MANNTTLCTSIMSCVVSMIVAQALMLQIAEFIVLVTSIAYHGFDRTQNSLIHKIDILAVVTNIFLHLYFSPDSFFVTLLAWYGTAIFLFRLSHFYKGKYWYLTSLGHAAGAYAHVGLASAMVAVASAT